MARDATANCDPPLENESAPQTGGSFHFDRELVDERVERHHLAGSKISLEQVARILAFRSLGEIADAVKKINADYPKHSGAARQIAREIFEAEKVLKSLLDRAGI